jgi:DHA2 family methylenomycin A resistance protein-like MFS transporter
VSAPGGRGEPATTSPFTVLPLLAVCSGYFMVILDVTVINVAVPRIGEDLNASLTQVQWVTDGYTLVFAAGLLLGGALGDRLGNRRVFSWGIVVFTVSSALCALAWNSESLIAARLLEGAGAAMIVPGSLALLNETYPSAAHRARAFGIWAALAGVAACAGPVVGGLLTSTVGWRWVFVVNLPIGAFGLIACLARVGRSPVQPGRRMDWPAQVAVAAAIAFAIGGLNQAGDDGWGSAVVILLLILAVVSVVAFVLRERFARSPVLPLAFLTDPGIARPAAIGLLFNFAFYGMIFAASVSFERDLRLDPAVTGLALLPAMIMTVVASVLAGRLARAVPARRLMIIGLLIGAVGLTSWSLTGSNVEYVLLLGPMMAAGFGTAFTLPAATVTIMTSAPDGFAGTASALFNTTRQIGSAAGVAVGGSLLSLLGLNAGLRVSMLCGAAAFILGALLAAWNSRSLRERPAAPAEQQPVTDG